MNATKVRAVAAVTSNTGLVIDFPNIPLPPNKDAAEAPGSLYEVFMTVTLGSLVNEIG